MIIADEFDVGENFGIDRPSGMPDWEWLLLYTIRGEGLLYTGQDSPRVTKTGEIVLLRTGKRHGYHTNRGNRWSFLWLHCNAVPQLSYFNDTKLLICPFEAGNRRKQIFRAFRNIVYHTKNRSPLWRELCESILAELLLLLAEQNSSRLDSRVEEVLYLLTVRMKERVKIDDLASAVGLSASRLSHLFKEQTGHSILETLTDMRMRQAALLLEHTGCTASEAAYETGYQDYNNFLNHFRKHYGVSPREYSSASRRGRD